MFWISDKFAFPALRCVKSKLEELQGHKVAPLMSHKFDTSV